MSRNREEKTFQRRILVVVGQTRQKPDERLLHNVLRCRPIPQPADDKRQQPPLITVDALPPRLRVTGANATHQSPVSSISGHQMLSDPANNVSPNISPKFSRTFHMCGVASHDVDERTLCKVSRTHCASASLSGGSSDAS